MTQTITIDTTTDTQNDAKQIGFGEVVARTRVPEGMLGKITIDEESAGWTQLKPHLLSAVDEPYIQIVERAFEGSTNDIFRLLVRKKDSGVLEEIVLQQWGEAVPRDTFDEAYGTRLTIRPVPQPSMFHDETELTFKLKAKGREREIHLSSLFSHIESEDGFFVYIAHLDPFALLVYMNHINDLAANPQRRAREYHNILMQYDKIKENKAFVLWNAAIRLSSKTVQQHSNLLQVIYGHMRQEDMQNRDKAEAVKPIFSGAEQYQTLKAYAYGLVAGIIRGNMDTEKAEKLIDAAIVCDQYVEGVLTDLKFSPLLMRSSDAPTHGRVFYPIDARNLYIPATRESYESAYVTEAAKLVKMHIVSGDEFYNQASVLKILMINSGFWTEDSFRITKDETHSAR